MKQYWGDEVKYIENMKARLQPALQECIKNLFILQDLVYVTSKIF